MDLEAVLDVIGCKTRRDILALLTEEPRFVSQISQQLNIGQKAIIGHLKAMEDLGLINPSYKKIERGRPRKYYEISQDIEIKIFIKPDTINMHMMGEEFTELYNIEERASPQGKDSLKLMVTIPDFFLVLLTPTSPLSVLSSIFLPVRIPSFFNFSFQT